VEYAVPGDQGYIVSKPGSLEGMTEKTILKQVDLAAALGAELFIVDAGWWDVQGEWTPSTTRFPRGLAPIADYVHQKGMLFGLYTEVEGTPRAPWSECSWCKQHPDWFLPGFNNMLLDMTKPEVEAHIEGQLARIVQDYKLDLLREDYNFFYQGDYHLFDAGELGAATRDGFQENKFWRYYEAWYRIMERLHKKFPDLILQHASAGGLRNDLGMASRWQEPYLTDGLNTPHFLLNYAGQTLGQPPENFVIAVGIPVFSANQGHFDTNLRATFALATPWLAPVAPSLEDMSPERLERYRHYADLYKNFIRPIFPTAKMYHHAPITADAGMDSSPWFAVEFASPDRAKGWAMFVRVHQGDPDIYLFRPKGLDPAKSYRVTFDSTGSTAIVDGLRLLGGGIPIRLESTLSSELLLFEAQ
jgi:alpha-galactosidase